MRKPSTYNYDSTSNKFPEFEIGQEVREELHVAPIERKQTYKKPGKLLDRTYLVETGSETENRSVKSTFHPNQWFIVNNYSLILLGHDHR